jgi:hypothetical protein
LRIPPESWPGNISSTLRSLLPDRQRVEERPELEQHPDLADETVDLALLGGVDLDAADEDAPPIRAGEPHQVSQQHRLARSASTDHRHALPGRHLEVHSAMDPLPLAVDAGPDVAHLEGGGATVRLVEGRAHQKQSAVTR